MRWRGMWHVWVTREVYTGFGGETDRKKPLERPKCRWDDNIKIDL
jgi:hypothetical protein